MHTCNDQFCQLLVSAGAADGRRPRTGRRENPDERQPRQRGIRGTVDSPQSSQAAAGRAGRRQRRAVRGLRRHRCLQLWHFRPRQVLALSQIEDRALHEILDKWTGFIDKLVGWLTDCMVASIVACAPAIGSRQVQGAHVANFDTYVRLRQDRLYNTCEGRTRRRLADETRNVSVLINLP